jgi:GDP-4-dehydro-6-deoxy-D-mannose reductase
VVQLKALLTGAGGFVGSFMQRVFPCVPLVSAKGIRVDLRSIEDVREVIHRARPDVVIHLAAQSFVPRSFDDPKETFETDFLGTFNLLQALKEEKFTGIFLFSGSGEVYGIVPIEQLPIVEDRPLFLRNPYAVSKVAAEALCIQWSTTSPFRVVMARSF